MRTLAVLFATLLLAVGCNGGTTTPAPADLAVAAPDLTVLPDLAVTPPDMTRLFGCGDALDCIAGCQGDQGCGQACLNDVNTENGPALVEALNTCLAGAIQTTCKADCAGGLNQTCASCIAAACAAEQTACKKD